MAEPAVVGMAQSFQSQLRAADEEAILHMTRRWGAIESSLQAEIEALAQEIADLQEAGEIVSESKLYQLDRYQSLLAQVGREVSSYMQWAIVQMQDEAAKAQQMAQRHAKEMIMAQAGEEPTAKIRALWDRLATEPVEKLSAIARGGMPLNEILQSAYPAAVKGMTDRLLFGTAAGWHPRRTARAMIREGGLDQGLNHVLLVARDQQIRHYREMSRDAYKASNMVYGYKRIAAKNERTCMACLALDGRVYPTSEVMELHPQDRCGMIPLIVGRPIPEWETGLDWFKKQPPERQRKMLGAGRYKLWQEGGFDLPQIVNVKPNKVWGPNAQETPLRVLRQGGGGHPTDPPDPQGLLGAHLRSAQPALQAKAIDLSGGGAVLKDIEKATPPSMGEGPQAGIKKALNQAQKGNQGIAYADDQGQVTGAVSWKPSPDDQRLLVTGAGFADANTNLKALQDVAKAADEGQGLQATVPEELVTRYQGWGWEVHKAAGPGLPPGTAVMRLAPGDLDAFRASPEDLGKSKIKALASQTALDLGQSGQVATFKTGLELPGLPYQKAELPDDLSALHSVNDLAVDVDPLPDDPKRHPAAGIILFDPTSGKFVLSQPAKGYGGYALTIPKGTVEEGEVLQDAAIREVWEETGFVASIEGGLGDYKKSTSVNRFYIGVVQDGAPWGAGYESAGVKLVPPEQLVDLLGTEADKKIAGDFMELYEQAKEQGEGDWLKGLESIEAQKLVKAQERAQAEELAWIDYIEEGGAGLDIPDLQLALSHAQKHAPEWIEDIEADLASSKEAQAEANAAAKAEVDKLIQLIGNFMAEGPDYLATQRIHDVRAAVAYAYESGAPADVIADLEQALATRQEAQLLKAPVEFPPELEGATKKEIVAHLVQETGVTKWKINQLKKAQLEALNGKTVSDILDAGEQGAAKYYAAKAPKKERRPARPQAELVHMPANVQNATKAKIVGWVVAETGVTKWKINQLTKDEILALSGQPQSAYEAAADAGAQKYYDAKAAKKEEADDGQTEAEKNQAAFDRVDAYVKAQGAALTSGADLAPHFSRETLEAGQAAAPDHLKHHFADALAAKAQLEKEAKAQATQSPAAKVKAQPDEAPNLNDFETVGDYKKAMALWLDMPASDLEQLSLIDLAEIKSEGKAKAGALAQELILDKQVAAAQKDWLHSVTPAQEIAKLKKYPHEVLDKIIAEADNPGLVDAAKQAKGHKGQATESKKTQAQLADETWESFADKMDYHQLYEAPPEEVAKHFDVETLKLALEGAPEGVKPDVAEVLAAKVAQGGSLVDAAAQDQAPSTLPEAPSGAKSKLITQGQELADQLKAAKQDNKGLTMAKYVQGLSIDELTALEAWSAHKFGKPSEVVQKTLFEKKLIAGEIDPHAKPDLAKGEAIYQAWQADKSGKTDQEILGAYSWHDLKSLEAWQVEELGKASPKVVNMKAQKEIEFWDKTDPLDTIFDAIADEIYKGATSADLLASHYSPGDIMAALQYALAYQHAGDIEELLIETLQKAATGLSQEAQDQLPQPEAPTEPQPKWKETLQQWQENKEYLKTHNGLGQPPHTISNADMAELAKVKPELFTKGELEAISQLSGIDVLGKPTSGLPLPPGVSQKGAKYLKKAALVNHIKRHSNWTAKELKQFTIPQLAKFFEPDPAAQADQAELDPASLKAPTGTLDITGANKDLIADLKAKAQTGAGGAAIYQKGVEKLLDQVANGDRGFVYLDEDGSFLGGISLQQQASTLKITGAAFKNNDPEVNAQAIADALSVAKELDLPLYGWVPDPVQAQYKTWGFELVESKYHQLHPDDAPPSLVGKASTTITPQTDKGPLPLPANVDSVAEAADLTKAALVDHVNAWAGVTKADLNKLDKPELVALIGQSSVGKQVAQKVAQKEKEAALRAAYDKARLGGPEALASSKEAYTALEYIQAHKPDIAPEQIDAIRERALVLEKEERESVPFTPRHRPRPMPELPPDPQLPEHPDFPDAQDLDSLRVVQRLGGSTGAELVEDPATGKRYVRKFGDSPGHVRNEVYADEIYRAAGYRVPRAQLYEQAGRPVKLAEFIEGQDLGTALRSATGKEKAKLEKQLQDGFALDALLGNWDVAGANMDNILVDKDGNLWRIDNGGSLSWRAMGGQKEELDWNGWVTDFWSMRDPNIGGAAAHSGSIYRKGNWYDYMEQAQRLADMAPELLAKVPAGERLVLHQRLEHLRDMAGTSKVFQRDRYRPEFADELHKHSANIRQGGWTPKGERRPRRHKPLDEILPQKLTVKGKGNTDGIYDENGRHWDNFKDEFTKMAETYMKEQGHGVTLGILNDYMDQQGGSSLARVPLGMKYYEWLQRGKPDDAWIGNRANAKKQYERMAQIAGGEEQLHEGLSAWRSFVFESLRNTPFRFNNTERGYLQLVRTESSDGLDGNRPDPGQWITTSSRGGLDSCSIYHSIKVNNDPNLIAMRVPYHRVMGFYFHSRPGGRSSFPFLGPGENEFVANLTGLEFVFVSDDYSRSRRPAEDIWEEVVRATGETELRYQETDQ